MQNNIPPSPSEIKKISEFPSVSEGKWESLSVSSAIFTFVCFSAVAVWILEGGIEQGDVWKIQIFTPFGVALFAGVTYCTVNWRGKITTRQADLAASQLRLSERESKAKLLQEGAKLLGELGKPSHVSAGISTLAILILSDDEEFAVQAMNLVADLVQREMASSDDHVHREEAFLALKKGQEIGRQSDREIRFDANSSETRWKILYGVKNVLYVGGCFLGLNGKVDVIPYDMHFSGVKFDICENMIFGGLLSRCQFNECSISEVQNFWSSTEPEMEHEFNDCDFSGAVFESVETLRWICGNNNYFVYGNPPVIASGKSVEWKKYFDIEENSRMPILF